MTVDIEVVTPSIRLDAFLKWSGIASTGGQAKMMVADGEVMVNGELPRGRSQELVAGDVVSVRGTTLRVVCKTRRGAGGDRQPTGT
jgi:ribosome-associated protein